MRGGVATAHNERTAVRRKGCEIARKEVGLKEALLRVAALRLAGLSSTFQEPGSLSPVDVPRGSRGPREPVNGVKGRDATDPGTHTQH